MKSGYSWQDDAAQTDGARLLDIKATAQYLGGISEWTVRAFVANGDLAPVRLPSVRRPGEFSRRLLFAVEDLDALIERGRNL